MSTVHFVVPDGIDDPARPTGGNTYDRNLFRGLTAIGWSVHRHAVAGFWSEPEPASFAALEDAVRRIPDGAVVLLDGLIASTAPEVLERHASRLQLVVLVHMPLGHSGPGPGPGPGEIRMRERAALCAVDAVVTTSEWSRRRLIELYALPGEDVHVAEPGADAAELAPGTAEGAALLTVAAVTDAKGHDAVLDALAAIADLRWQWTCVGSLDRAPGFAGELRRRAREEGLADRVRFAGTSIGAELDRAYAASDVMVLASRSESYGMVVTEALARGLPVIACRVGGVAEALGHGVDGIRPGLLVGVDDPAALADAIRSWLTDAQLRARLRAAARERRASLPEWSSTTSIVAGVLAGLER